MRVRKLILKDDWVLYYIFRLNVYVSDDALEIIADELGERPLVVQETHCQGYLEGELKAAIRLKDDGVEQ